MRRTAWITFSVMTLCWGAFARAESFPVSSDTRSCDDGLTRRIPSRPPEAPDGSAFVARLSGLTDDQREAAILEQLLAGNIPQFLRHLTPVRLTGNSRAGAPLDVTVCVSPDYVAIGSDRDFLLVPMRLRTALMVAHQFRFALPTPRMVDAIYAQAALHLQPQPLPASDTMRTTAYYWQHNELVQQQRASLGARLGALTAGDKKDLVLTNRLWSSPGRVAIYGWHRQNGNPIQPLSTVHGARYADYSHGVRFVSDTAYLDGKEVPLLALLQNPQVSAALSGEGRIRKPADLLSVLTRYTPPLAQNLQSAIRDDH